jgi:exodeoxyribonuclease VII small subunit
MADIKFEKAMGRLETIVQEMEKGEVSLEESLKLFEEGIRLSQVCTQKLDEAEGKVEILLKERGEKVARPFLAEGTEGNDRPDGADS